MAQQHIQRLLSGDRRTLSRLITRVERREPGVPELLQELQPYLGNAYCIGITGPPGAGKSTLVNGLASLARDQGMQIGILAVDPSSIYSGGAVLGDRIRMRRHVEDSGVFIRSMATHGAHGGLSSSLPLAISVLDAAGIDLVLVETAGAGQMDLDIATVADTSVVTLVPEAGDAIQTMKAGLTEIGDIFVVNKADRDGADSMVMALKAMLSLGKKTTSGWRIPVLSTEARKGKGITELYQAIRDHRNNLESTSTLETRRKERRRRVFLLLLEEALRERLSKMLEGEGTLVELSAAVERGQLDPLSAAQKALRNMTPV